MSAQEISQGPFIVCWKTTTASLDVQINDICPAFYACDIDALHRIIDTKIDDLIMRKFLQQSGNTDVLNVQDQISRSGLSHIGTSYYLVRQIWKMEKEGLTEEFTYEDELLRRAVIAFGCMMRILIPDEDGVLVDAWKPAQKINKLSIAALRKRCSAEGTVLSLIATRVHAICIRNASLK